MLDLKEYIKESLLDDFDTMSKKQDKAFIQEVKNWIKSNVWKGSGRIKIDAKTGEVTLPSNTDIRITCPVMNGITFNSFEPWSIYMEKATESDLIAVCKNIDKKHEYYLKLRYAELSNFPKELDGMSGAIEIDVLKNNIDFNDVKLNLCKLHIDAYNVNVSGTKNINIIESGYVHDLSLDGVNMKDDLGIVDIPTGNITLRRITSKKTLLKGAKNTRNISIDNSSDIDLSKCSCEYLWLGGIDENYNYSFLPKKLDYLVINSTEDYHSFDLNRIKSSIGKLTFNNAVVDLNMSPEERDVIYDVNKMKSFIKGEATEIPKSLIKYVAKHSKEVKDFDAMQNGKTYLTMCADKYDKSPDGILTNMAYYDDFQKRESQEVYDYENNLISIRVDIDGWKSSWIYNDLSQKFEYHDGWKNLRHNYDAKPERLYKDKGKYFIKNYKIFEIPSSFKPFIEKVMGK